MITFTKMSPVSVKASFKLWKKENVNEPLVDPTRGMNWYFAVENRNLIGFVGLMETPIAPVTLETIFVYEKYRHQGYSIKIRNALVKQKRLQALTIGRYVDDPSLLIDHANVAKQSGFVYHYVVGMTDGPRFEGMGDVFLSKKEDADLYPRPLYAMPYEQFRDGLQRK
jgi:hypothetical protein